MSALPEWAVLFEMRGSDGSPPAAVTPDGRPPLTIVEKNDGFEYGEFNKMLKYSVYSRVVGRACRAIATE
ncbi:peptidase family protein [Edwardsiella piscicida]|nr:peptidase family protein [Edwardsiella piscicida]